MKLKRLPCSVWRAADARRGPRGRCGARAGRRPRRRTRARASRRAPRAARRAPAPPPTRRRRSPPGHSRPARQRQLIRFLC